MCSSVRHADMASPVAHLLCKHGHKLCFHSGCSHSYGDIIHLLTSSLNGIVFLHLYTLMKTGWPETFRVLPDDWENLLKDIFLSVTISWRQGLTSTSPNIFQEALNQQRWKHDTHTWNRRRCPKIKLLKFKRSLDIQNMHMSKCKLSNIVHFWWTIPKQAIKSTLSTIRGQMTQ